MPENYSQLPLSYRSELLKKVITSLRAGECCSLIGTSGVGKSNLARFLYRLDVQRHYWGDDLVWILLIDLQSLVLDDEKADYAVLELIVYYLLEEAERRDSPAEFLQQVRQLHTQLTEKGTAYQALRSLQDICRHLCVHKSYTLVFVFDQFEDIWQSLPARFFRNLRHLRDEFKYRLVFLVMTRDRLQRICPDTLALEAFWELFTAHTYGLGPYSKDDAVVMIERLASRVGAVVTTESLTTLLHFSGHHPGLLRTLFWALYDEQWRTLGIDELLKIPSVTEECKKIWTVFSPTEQSFLQLLAQGIPPIAHHSIDPSDDLCLKGIIQGNPPALFSPLFAAYVQRLPESSLMGVCIDTRSRQVWLDGQLLPQAPSPLEFKLLTYLVKHVGSVCSQKDLVRDLYNDHYTRNDQRIYALITRLRRALGENAHQQRYIITHHGGGVQLLKGRIIDGEDT